MQEGEKGKGQDYGNTVRHPCSLAARQPVEQGTKKLGKNGFAQRADGQTGERNADLHAGNDAIELTEECVHNAGSGVAAVHKLAHVRGPHGHQRKLRGGKKAVDGHQQQYGQETKADHVLQF